MTVRSLPLVNDQPVIRSAIFTRHAINSSILALLYGLKFNAGISADFQVIMNNIQPLLSTTLGIDETVDKEVIFSYI
ncbi:MAG: hypothetical protein ACTSRU_11970, partial [Candidatus Hodarchaeales archaeon]